MNREAIAAAIIGALLFGLLVFGLEQEVRIQVLERWNDEHLKDHPRRFFSIPK